MTDNAGNILSNVIKIDLTNFNAAKAAAAKLEQQNVNYTQAKTDLAAAQAAMDKLSDNAKAQLAAEQQLIAATKTKLDSIAAGITAVADKIAALPEITDTLTAANLTAITEARDEANALFAQGVEGSDISGYTDKLVPLLEKASAELAKIDTAKQKLKVLADMDLSKMTFADKGKIDAAQEAVDAVDAAVSGALTEDDRKPLADALAAYQKLVDDQTALETKLKALKPDEIKLTDEDTIKGLRSQVTAMTNDLHATLDSEALANLKAAEDALMALKNKSEEIHNEIKNLPEKTTYDQKDAIKALRDEMNNLKNNKGDTSFTPAEENKVTSAENAIAAIDARINTAKLLHQPWQQPE